MPKIIDSLFHWWSWWRMKSRNTFLIFLKSLIKLKYSRSNLTFFAYLHDLNLFWDFTGSSIAIVSTYCSVTLISIQLSTLLLHNLSNWTFFCSLIKTASLEYLRKLRMENTMLFRRIACIEHLQVWFGISRKRIENAKFNFIVKL